MPWLWLRKRRGAVSLLRGPLHAGVRWQDDGLTWRVGVWLSHYGRRRRVSEPELRQAWQVVTVWLPLAVVAVAMALVVLGLRR